MGTYEYVVAQIDGDYAQLQRVDEPSGELKLVARALLPEDIMEGSHLKYECLQYELLDQKQKGSAGCEERSQDK